MLAVIKPIYALCHSIVYVHLSSVPKSRLKYLGYEPLIGGASVL